jgi:hypothetical protein
MAIDKYKPARWLLILATMVIGSACILQAAAGPTATPQVILIPGESQTESMEPAASSPTLEIILSLTPTFTLTPEPTSTATTAPITMVAGQNLSCVKGPHWILFEWVAYIAEGEVVTLLAKASPEWQEYYYVRTSGGKECWAYGGSSTKSGDPASLPVREAPPLSQVTFIVQNNTYLRVDQLFIRGKDSTDWGADRLAATLNYGQTYSLTLTAGFYDVLIKDFHNGIVYEKNDTPVGPGPSSRTAVVEGRYSQRFHSATTVEICRVHIESSDEVYQENLTIPGDGRISPGEDVFLESLGGSFETLFYRCGEDDSYWYGISSVYFGPSAYTITIH